jgi:hypothetical protein
MTEDEDGPPWQLEQALQPPPEVTRELFLTWRAARRGDGNPQRMTNPVWSWLARQPEVSAYHANRHFAGPGGPPGWTNQRFGQSTTRTPDGRTIAIAGEHEDYYDPDFFIYNDVIVVAPDGSVEIYGYPGDVLPPTDFHSATLVGDHIYVLGNLGYGEQRGDRIQVLRVDASTLAVEVLATRGEYPGWISKHTAVPSSDGLRITVSGGRLEVERGDRRLLRDSVDDHVLDLRNLTWTRTTDRRWTQHDIVRSDGAGQLWDIQQVASHVDRDDEWSREQVAYYRARIGHEPDLVAWRARFQPPIDHDTIPSVPEEWNVHRIVVEGVTVRYVDESNGVRVVVEGSLPAATVAALVEDVRAKLERADRGPYVARCVD